MPVGASLAAVLSAALAAVGASAGTAVDPASPTRSGASTVTASSSPVVGASWVWPLDAPHEVLRGFAPPAQRWLPGHRGVDLAARTGDPVRAAQSGTITWAGSLAGRGVLVVEHPGGMRSTFEPVMATLPVGTVVTRGEQVATVTDGPGHCAPQTCLHWGVLHGRAYVDPLSLLARAPIVLLPLS